MFPNPTNSSFHTPPNPTARPSNSQSILWRSSLSSSGFSSCSAASKALAIELLNQSPGGDSYFTVASDDSFEQLSNASLGSFSLVDSPTVEYECPVSPQIKTPRPPTRLMEPIPVFSEQSEGGQRTQLRSELLNWVSANPNGVEAAERRDVAVQIISCFHNQAHELSIKAGNITALPSCIGLLGHLQILDLSNCRSLKLLPNVLHNFVNLQTLNLTNCQNLTRLPPTVNALRWCTSVVLNGSGVDLTNPLQSQLNKGI